MKSLNVCGKISALIIAASILAGCVARSNTAVIQSNQPGAAQQAIGGTRVVTRTAIAGQALLLDGSWELNPDCSVRGFTAIRITQQPSHGTLKVSQRDDFPNYPAANPRSSCNKTRAAGNFIEYTASPGYTGSDFLVFEMITTTGIQVEYKNVITVK
jgi:hypothetical protein